MSNKFIDIEALFKSKNPKLLKWLPGFVLRYLKRVLHQDEINDFMFRNKHLKDYDFCKQVIGVGMVFAVVVPTIQCGRSLVAAIRRTFKAIKTNSLKMVEPDFFDPHDLLS